MKVTKGKYFGFICSLLVLLSAGSSLAQVTGKVPGSLEKGVSKLAPDRAKIWRMNFKRARHNILLFNTAVDNYYNAVLMGYLDKDPRAVDRMINGSIAARQSINQIKRCPEEYKRECELVEEIYGLIKKKELMAENRQVAFNQLEEWKGLKKRVDERIDELEKLLKVH